MALPDAHPLTVSWQRHAGELQRFAARRLGDAHLAEEAVAEAFMAACQAYDSAEVSGHAPPGNLRAWLFSVLRRKVVDVLRRESAAGRAAQDVARLLAEPTDVFKDGFFVARPSAWRADPAAAADAAEFWRAFEASVDALPLRMRQAFVLRELDQESAQTVCQVLGISPTNLWTLLHRARLRLREDLGPWFES